MSGKHLGLVAAAKLAIDKVLEDRSTDQRTILESLEEIQQILTERIEHLELPEECDDD